MIDVLFVARDSVYKSIQGCDCWDIDRNALHYVGKNPVVCHPPCRSWSRLKHFAKPIAGEHELAILAVEFVRQNGGVLEHPMGSHLFHEILPRPGFDDQFGGYTILIDQFPFGHYVRKRTYLYIVGCHISKVPALHLCFNIPSRKFDNLSSKKRSHTPLAFALWLIELAKLCQ